ncbi:MAG TPA: DinB family protein [Candidatus Limnocylindrales bacterium]|nr:DinB family protein [Candidatus Limnocylindrales bacterium]
MIDRPALLARLDAVADRLRALAERDREGLTAPDTDTGERWEAAQVWGHLAEFPEYWLPQVRGVIDARSEEPVPFGRTKRDPERAARIEARRALRPAEAMAAVEASLAGWRELVDSLGPDDLARRGLHPTIGEMTVPAMLERFLLNHLEEHAEQLESLPPA